MAQVRTFWISSNPKVGVPDYKIRDFIDECEEQMGIVTVHSTFIPSLGTADARLTVVVTKLDDDHRDGNEPDGFGGDFS